MARNDRYGGGEDDSRTVVANALASRTSTNSRDRHLLIQLEGGPVGRVVVICGSTWCVGRDPVADLCLDDGSVSRRHAQFVWQPDGYALVDLDSVNGTFVSGVRVAQHALRDGDIVQFGSGVVFRYSVADAQEEAMLQHLYDASVTDVLTGARNREYFDSCLAAELSFARRHRSALSLLLLDLDRFKHINDTFGHEVGDLVLSTLSKAILADMRKEDVFARYGGEEFVVLLRGVDLAGAGAAAERFRQRLARLRVPHGAQTVAFTVSVGCSSLACCDEWTAEQLLAVADRRLYAAKHGGRNMVVATG